MLEKPLDDILCAVGVKFGGRTIEAGTIVPEGKDSAGDYHLVIQNLTRKRAIALVVEIYDIKSKEELEDHLNVNGIPFQEM